VIEKNRFDLSQKSIAMNKLFFAKIFATAASSLEKTAARLN
jgi:hypothetical protein